MDLTIRQTVLLSGAAGTVFGAAIGFFMTKKLLQQDYEDRIQFEIAEARDFYEQRLRQVKPEPEKLSGLESGDAQRSSIGIGDAVKTLVNYGNVDPELPEKIAGEGVTVVTNIFNNRGEEIDVIENVWDYDTELRNRTMDAPFIISDEEFLLGEKDYEQTRVTYYEEDGVLADDRDQMIPDADEKVGDHNLAKKGHGSKDKNMLYVRNDVIEIDFEVAFSNGSYAQQVLGFEHSADTSQRRRRGGRHHWDDE